MTLADVMPPVGTGLVLVGMVVGSGGSQQWTIVGILSVVIGFLLLAPAIFGRW